MTYWLLLGISVGLIVGVGVATLQDWWAKRKRERRWR